MHPILTRGRLRLYLAAWVPAGLFMATMAGVAGGRGWVEALALTLPLALVLAFVCLGSWSLCRAMPLGRTGFGRLAAAHALAAALSSGLWVLVGAAWARALGRILSDPGAGTRYARDLPVFFAAGIFLFILVAAVHYLLIAFEASRAAEKRALEAQVLAREAQMKTLTAQVNPHFLFNSLNAISALTGSDPAAARRMCVMLAGVLRSSLALGARERVTLAEELALVDSFLAVEQVRFGERLSVAKEVGPEAGRCLVPPLLLQPLVENAVNHGIAHRLEGGTVRIGARSEGGRLELAVANEADPDRPASRGQGLGLANVRARLAALYGPAARMEIAEQRDRFEVRLSLPAEAGLDGMLPEGS